VQGKGVGVERKVLGVEKRVLGVEKRVLEVVWGAHTPLLISAL